MSLASVLLSRVLFQLQGLQTSLDKFCHRYRASKGKRGSVIVLALWISFCLYVCCVWSKFGSSISLAATLPLTYMSYTTPPWFFFLSCSLWDRPILNFPDWPWTCIVIKTLTCGIPALASWIARITWLYCGSQLCCALSVSAKGHVTELLNWSLGCLSWIRWNTHLQGQ